MPLQVVTAKGRSMAVSIMFLKDTQYPFDAKGCDQPRPEKVHSYSSCCSAPIALFPPDQFSAPYCPITTWPCLRDLFFAYHARVFLCACCVLRVGVDVDVAAVGLVAVCRRCSARSIIRGCIQDMGLS